MQLLVQSLCRRYQSADYVWDLFERDKVYHEALPERERETKKQATKLATTSKAVTIDLLFAIL